MSRTPGQFTQFVLLRVVSTALSYAVYLLGLLVLGYEAAYFVAYVFGIAIAWLGSSLLVFRTPLTARSALRFPLVYVVQLALGWVVLKVAVENLGVPEWAALAFSIAVTLPLTFVLSRWATRPA